MTSAFVLLNVKTGFEEELLSELKKIDSVKEAHRVYGVYDTLIKIEADTIKNLKEILTWKIRRLPQVESTLTMLVVGD